MGSRPERDGREVVTDAGVLEDPDDPGRALEGDCSSSSRSARSARSSTPDRMGRVWGVGEKARETTSRRQPSAAATRHRTVASACRLDPGAGYVTQTLRGDATASASTAR